MSATSGTVRRGFSRSQLLILCTVQLCTLLFGMTVTVANVVLPQIKGALSTTQDQVAWVVTFNLVATAIGTPLTGWLATRFGWRVLMTGAVTGFVIATFLCGLAPSLLTLVLFRIAQGFFGAPLMPLGQAILLASFEKHHHPLVLMLWGIGGVIGPVLGPIAGGFVAESLGWRWVFYMIVPFGILAMFVAWISLGDQERSSERRFDWLGFSALAIAVACLQLIVNRGQRLDWFDSTEIVIESLLAATAFYIFLVHSATASRPFFDPGLIRDRNFALGIVLALGMGCMSYTPIVLFPPLLQELRGYPDSLVGLLLAARGLGNWLSFVIVVPMTRLYPRTTLALGLIAQGVAGLAMGRLSINLSNADVFWTNLLQGFGFGLAYTPMAVLIFATLEPRLITQGSALFNMLRNLGSSVFISLSVVVLIHTSAQTYDRFRDGIAPYSERFSLPITGDWQLSNFSGLANLSHEMQRQADMVGYTNAFYLFAAAAFATLPFVLWLRPPRVGS
ncbi:MAG: DHA2 family efflux MFS transporter permease subunit [Pseudomonadota bacterium]